MGSISPVKARQHVSKGYSGDIRQMAMAVRKLVNGEVYTEYAGNPTSNVTPANAGEWCLDTTNNIFYRSKGTASTDWISIGTHGLTAAELAFLDGVTAGTVSASKAVVADASGQVDGFKVPVTAGSTTANLSNSGIKTLSSTSDLSYAMDAPEAGVEVVLACLGTSTFIHTVTLDSGTFDGTNHIAKLDGDAEVLSLKGLSTSAYTVMGNVGSVALSTQ